MLQRKIHRGFAVFLVMVMAAEMWLQPILGVMHALTAHPAVALHEAGAGHAPTPAPEQDDDGGDALHQLMHFAHCCAQSAELSGASLVAHAAGIGRSYLLPPGPPGRPGSTPTSPFRPPIQA